MDTSQNLAPLTHRILRTPLPIDKVHECWNKYHHKCRFTIYRITSSNMQCNESITVEYVLSLISVQRAMRYWIVDTDYHTFAIAHSCVNRYIFWREEFTWVISRTRMLTGDALLHVQQRFILSGLDGTSIVPTNQERCTHPESEGGREDEGTRDDDDVGDERDTA